VNVHDFKAKSFTKIDMWKIVNMNVF
jgi:hypothetical protein